MLYWKPSFHLLFMGVASLVRLFVLAWSFEAGDTESSEEFDSEGLLSKVMKKAAGLFAKAAGLFRNSIGLPVAAGVADNGKEASSEGYLSGMFS